MALDKVIDSAELDANLTAVADAIRTKGGTTGELEFPGDFVSAVEGIQAGGGTSLEDALLTDTLGGTYTNNRITKIATSCFGGRKSVHTVNANNLTELGDYAFSGCPNLKTINFADKLTKVGRESFGGCGFTEFSSTSLITVGRGIFQNCNSLVSVSLPNATALGNYLCNGCKYLENVYLPKVETAGSGEFMGCTSLERIDLPKLTSLADAVFKNASKLRVVALRNQGVSTLMSVSAFNNTYFASGKTGGVLLVPAAQVEAYKTASNWSAIYGYGTNRFLALEDYTLDGTIMGEIDWDKVNALF